ncbi:SpoIVB peptidase S55 domain-containing protein [Solibacillus isronensis]|uniref:SpoIVB peptidase S55 domain-containing protein n=1 Tax=Solibacillus isronensis TaxID=412383 RepID=UPI0039A2F6CB
MIKKWSILVALLFMLAPIEVLGKSLIPMGHSIGVQLEMPYVMVAQDVLLENSEWLKKGEHILELNGEKVSQLEDIAGKGESFTLTVENGKQQREINVSGHELVHLKPFLKSETDGIGTLTYIDPETMEYGALGHQIVDSTMKQPPKFNDGAIFEASISQVKKSTPGQPGYKISVVDKSQMPLGSVISNDVYGIFGNWKQSLHDSLHPPLEIIHANELKKGKAQILTAIDGEEVNLFDIEIDKQTDNTFTFNVVDERLIKKTGGIVQGMSGSPIIQNNQFVGAVTHMFIEEPTKGAGILVIEMLKKSPY